MPPSKYGKYILSELKMPAVEAPWSPPNLGPAGRGRGGRIFYLDGSIIPGAYYMECVWVMPRPATTQRVGTEAHTHDYDEIIAFIGTNPEDPYDLGAEVELWLEDEKHIITRSSLVFIPAGLKHAPLYFLRVERPVFHFTTGPAKMYF